MPYAGAGKELGQGGRGQHPQLIPCSQTVPATRCGCRGGTVKSLSSSKDSKALARVAQWLECHPRTKEFWVQFPVKGIGLQV